MIFNPVVAGGGGAVDMLQVVGSASNYVLCFNAPLEFKVYGGESKKLIDGYWSVGPGATPIKGIRIEGNILIVNV